jgi:predicted dithiol-disulfide oxidoreductase (DUF899 family)
MSIDHRIVSKSEWKEARKALLLKEKALTEQRDRLAEERRALPWVRIDKPYRFQGSAGPLSFADLFAGKRQLAMYHLMFGPDWEAACKSCSFWADNFAGIASHAPARDVAFTAVSRAPLAKLQAYAKRLGWSFPWVSSAESDFNFDFGVSFTPEQIAAKQVEYNYTRVEQAQTEMPGVSTFFKDDDGTIYHTFSTFGRGIEPLNAVYGLLDLVPRGRDEAGLPNTMAWVRRNDEYAR